MENTIFGDEEDDEDGEDAEDDENEVQPGQHCARNFVKLLHSILMQALWSIHLCIRVSPANVVSVFHMDAIDKGAVLNKSR